MNDRNDSAAGSGLDVTRLGSPGPDFGLPNAARIYDYLLGGAHNTEPDRERAQDILELNPDIGHACQGNRTYLRRVVQWCSRRGIDQFLDLGSGIPTVGNVHEIARRHNPQARVAYVDNEPVAVIHSSDFVKDLDGVTVTQADLCEPEALMSAPGVVEVIDFTRPVALLCVAVLHFVPAPDLAAILARYRAALAPGSVHALSHGSADQPDPAVADRMRATQQGYARTANAITLRDRHAIRALLGESNILAEPGLVDVVHWPTRDPSQRETGVYAGAVLLSDRGC